MKSRNRSNYLIVLAVIVCSAVLLAALTFALYGFQWEKGGRTLEIELRASTGIKLHSPVRYAGAPAGAVTRIRFLTADERRKSINGTSAVRVTVRLAEDVPPITEGTTAELASETLLGEKFVLLSPGDPDAPPLPEGAVIRGKDLTALDDLARSARDAIENVNGILTGLKKDYPDLVLKLSDLLDQGNSVLRQGSNFVGHADGALTNASQVIVDFKSDYAELIDRLNSLLSQAKTIATNANQAVEQAGAFVGRADSLVENNEANLGRMLEELRVVSQNLKVISTYTKALTRTLGEKPSRLIWGGKKSPLPNEQAILESTDPVPVEPPRK